MSKHQADLKPAKILLATLGCALLLSCGPVNNQPTGQNPKIDTSASAAGTAPKADGNHYVNGLIALSANDSFVVLGGFQDANGKTGTKFQMGANTFMLHITHADDLSPLGKDATVAVTFTRVTSKIPTPHPLPVTQGADGGYSGPLTLSKSGGYNIEVTITDGTLKDTYEFPFTL